MAGTVDVGLTGAMSVEEITLHGHRVSYRREGWGEPILLIHGITGSSATWDDVIPFLRPFAKVTRKNEPFYGLIVTAFIAELAVLMGEWVGGGG